MMGVFEKKMNWSCLNTKEDLLQLFTDCVDRVIIEEVIAFRKNNLLLAHRDLISIIKPQDYEKNQKQVVGVSHLNIEEDQLTAVTNDSNDHVIDWKRLSNKESPNNRILYLVSKRYKVMVLMRGCPGSGKSYQANNILNQCYINANVDEFIFSADKYFINKHTGRYRMDKNKLPKAHQFAYQNVFKAVQLEITPVIVDNTNIKAWEMEKYFQLAVKNGYWIEILEPCSEWAWICEELVRKNQHNVPYDAIAYMLNQYDHTVTVDNMLTKYKFKYNKHNKPPQLCNKSQKYQLCKNLIDENKVINTPPIEINDFKNLNKTQKQSNTDVKRKDQCISFNNGHEDSMVTPTMVQYMENLSVVSVETSSLNIPDIDKELYNEVASNYVDKSVNTYEKRTLTENLSVVSAETSSPNIADIDEELSNEVATNYVDKSVNTYENDFLFMEVLNEIPEEEYKSYVIFGTNRDINEGCHSILNLSSGKLDKGTTTNVNDLVGINLKLNLNELHKHFTENVCLLITELFDKCEGNIDWMRDMLKESGHDISKQKLNSLILCVEDNCIENIKVQKNIDKLKQDYILPINFSSSNNNDILVEEISKKKKRRKKKDKILQTIDKNLDSNLKKNIENKFVFGDSSYSEHVLKIKEIKNNDNLMDDDIMPSTPKIDDDKSVQIVVDTSILTQLCDYFGDYSFDLSKTTLPMSVKLPEKLAEDLYYCLIANVPPDIYDQEAILQDEILARKLQETCKKEFSSNVPNSSPGELTFAEVLSKNDKFQVKKASGIECSKNLDSPSLVENEESNVNNLLEQEFNVNQNFKLEALKHANLRQHFLNKANQSICTKIHPAVTAHYLDKAAESKQNENYAKTQALVNYIKQNETATTLDLHNLQVQDAVQVLDFFLDNHISNLRKLNGMYSRGRQLTVITGRGKHSPKGIARIKPVVLRRLQARRLIYLEPETPGLIMIIIKKNSMLSLEF